MRELRVFLLAIFLGALPLQAQQGRQDVHPYFSPNGGCTQAVVDQLNGAKQQVLVQAYSFTSTPIARALVDAKRRGVDVEVILDKSQRSERYSSATFLANEGVPTYIDHAHKIAHNKVMVIDGQTVITGSFNFTKSAEEGNAENLLVINNAPQLAQKYAQNWKAHLGHSSPYTGLSSQSASSVPAASTGWISPEEPSSASQPGSSSGYWLSKSGVRHNSNCKWYQHCAGGPCGAGDGRACKICGG